MGPQNLLLVWQLHAFNFLIGPSSHLESIQAVANKQELQESAGGWEENKQRMVACDSVLQIVLAVGNYMNAGNYRVGGAIGFKIKFLTQVWKKAWYSAANQI